MLPRPRYSQGHDFLVKVMQDLQYDLGSGKEYCAGICTAALISFYSSGDLTIFDDRIQLIQHTLHLAEKIIHLKKAKAEEKQKSPDKKISYSTEEQNYLDVLGFFDTILLAHDPVAYKHIFQEIIPQSEVMQAHRFFTSTKLHEQARKKKSEDSLLLAKKWPGLYTQTEMRDYLYAWHNACGQSNTDLALTFGSDTHRILLCYKHDTKRWKLVDPRSLPSQANFKLLSDLANAVHASLQNSNLSIIETCVYATPDNLAAVNQAIKSLEKSADFRAIQHITEDKAQLVSQDGINLAYIASRNGHYEEITKLKAKGAKLTTETEEGWTLAHIAAQNGYGKVIKTLDSAKVNMDKPNRLGSTPFFIACQEGHVDAAKALLKTKKVKVNQPNHNGVTPAMIAAARGNIGILALLKKHVDLTVVAQNKAVLDIAKENDHKEVIDYLNGELQQANLKVR